MISYTYWTAASILYCTLSKRSPAKYLLYWSNQADTKSKKNSNVNTKQKDYVFSSIESELGLCLFLCSAWSRLCLMTAKIIIDEAKRVINILSCFDNSGSLTSYVSVNTIICTTCMKFCAMNNAKNISGWFMTKYQEAMSNMSLEYESGTLSYAIKNIFLYLC